VQHRVFKSAARTQLCIQSATSCSFLGHSGFLGHRYQYPHVFLSAVRDHSRPGLCGRCCRGSHLPAVHSKWRGSISACFYFVPVCHCQEPNCWIDWGKRVITIVRL
jgi:hypothetical protein